MKKKSQISGLATIDLQILRRHVIDVEDDFLASKAADSDPPKKVGWDTGIQRASKKNGCSVPKMAVLLSPKSKLQIFLIRNPKSKALTGPPS